MKLIKVLICLAVIGLAGWIYKYKYDEQVKSMGGFNIPELHKPETPAQRDERNQIEAKAIFASAITNDVVGWHRTIKQDCWIGYGTSPNTWWATATVEFVNKVGGIERTQIYYRFKPSFGDVQLIRLDRDEYLAWISAKVK
jgi:hypothetical protein